MARQVTSAYRGVGWDASRGKWKVQIASKTQGWRHCCRVDSELEAARGYDALARVLLGEGAAVNFPGEALTQAGRAWAQGVIERRAGKARAARGRATAEALAQRAARAAAKRAAVARRREAEREAEAAEAAEAAIPTMGRHAARERFGVSLPTWERWEREGQVTCGRMVGGRKVYAVADIERLLKEHGAMRPAYKAAGVLGDAGCYWVPLGGRGMTREEALVDGETLRLLVGARCTVAGTGAGRFVSLYRSATGEHLPLRRVVMGVEGSKKQVGHANGDPLDCRRSNLVVRTAQERQRHTRKMEMVDGRPTTSRYKGVFFEKWTQRWRASIGVDGESIKLGRFDVEEDAAAAYDEAAREWFGEHARLNFPGAGEASAAAAA